MNIWIVTIGSSDVQLDSDNNCREKSRTEKQRSDKIWHYWYEDEIQADCQDIAFEPKQSYKDKNEPYRIEPRVLGMVYESSSKNVQDEIWSYLTFPLLDNFVGKLKNSPPDAIAVLLTEQSEIFKSTNERQKPKCPYWQDTCKLKPILNRYFQARFTNIKSESIKWVPLAPTSSEKGLDNWDYVLDLVDEKLRNLQINGKAVKKESVETVYVSHQAGTPAISSAVQFASLAQFEKKVLFLVSNEYNANLTEIVPSSRYLHKIQREKAKQLLALHDYSGVKELLYSSLTPEVEILLDAAIQWNFSKFEDFAKKLLQHSNANFVKEVQERTKKENWWWTAYEAAYLGMVRLEQGNTVEAMFHSFRAVEGLLRKWVEHNHSDKIHQGNRGKEIRVSDEQTFNLHGQDLYRFLETCYENKISKLDDIGIFGHHVFKKRNNLFHQLEGLQDKKAVFESWRSPNEKQWRDDAENKWKTRILNCLNFVSGETFEFLDKKDQGGKVASLMVKVHQELKKAIAYN